MWKTLLLQRGTSNEYFDIMILTVPLLICKFKLDIPRSKSLKYASSINPIVF